MNKSPAFKPYNQGQITFLPPSLEELIPKDHIARVVNDIVDRISTKMLIEKYEGGGTSSYHPVMMLKVIIYAYTQKIFTCRIIAKNCRENVMFMWLAAMNQPDYHTINRFRSERMKDIIFEIFAEVVELLHEMGYIRLEHYFLDGTKIESSASKYSWVWGKSTKRYKEKLKEKCRELFTHIEDLQEEENQQYDTEDLPELTAGQIINSEAIKKMTERINEKLIEEPKNKELKKVKRTLEKDYLPRMEKYEEQERILEERNSYSKTDHDATFMRMKEDPMKNGQLKPAYNVQIGTENQFILGYSIHQHAVDTSCMKDHIKKTKMHLKKFPNALVADAGYGSEENYGYLQEEKLTSYVKYGTYHIEKTSQWKKDPTKIQNWTYNEKEDFYICSNNRKLIFQKEQSRRSNSGFTSRIRIYISEDCSNCPYRDKCIRSEKADAVKYINVNQNLIRQKINAKTLLDSDEGIKLRKQRCWDVETVFGDIKGNFGMRRFLLKGLKKVEVEWGLISIAHNMRKVSLIGAR